MVTDAPVLALEGVSRAYPAGVTALRGVSLTVARGESIALCGPSGCGKSTLLHILCGLDRPTTGRVLFNGRAPASAREWARIRATRIGFVFQAFHLLPTLTALENVQIPMMGVAPGPRTRRRRAEALLERVGLATHLGQRPSELSGGECQRVAIARSLANTPDVILADEPTGNLDSATSATVLDLLAEIRARDGVTLVIATHDPAISARAERTIHMLDGQVRAAAAQEAGGACAF